MGNSAPPRGSGTLILSTVVIGFGTWLAQQQVRSWTRDKLRQQLPLLCLLDRVPQVSNPGHQIL